MHRAVKISMIIPTRDRPKVLRETLERLSQLDSDDLGECELLVIDNNSREPIALPDRLGNGLFVRHFRLTKNMHAAARNIGAREASGEWLVMLDDDSSPLPCALSETLRCLPEEVAAVGGEIRLPSAQRESGGLPEVIVGCGCVIRKEEFLRVGGYDPSFGYYAEEYDLCAKLILAGHRVVQTRSLLFEHRKSTVGRDFNEIMFRLVRNNAWVLQRYAPELERSTLIERMIDRYRVISIKESADEGFARGLRAVEETIAAQTRTPLGSSQWDRFTGRAAVRSQLQAALAESHVPVRLVGPSSAKGREIVESELLRLGSRLEDTDAAQPVISSISPGPMLDLSEQNPDAIMPWFLGSLDQVHAPMHTIR